MTTPVEPISTQVFHILLALADGPTHGYAIMQQVERETGGEIRLGPGTLYGAIRRLRADGLIESAPGDNETRRRYRLTARGRRTLAREAARLSRMVDAARERRLLPEPGGR